MKYILRGLLVALIFLISFSCEKKLKTKVTISGKIGFIDEKYYEVKEFETEIMNMKSGIEYNSSYPQAYRYLLEDDKGKLLFNKGFLFVDRKTEIIQIDTAFTACPIYEYNDSNYEYRYKFVPFYYKTDDTDCKIIIENLYFNKEEDDFNLNNYIIENPNSYVALWHLIERVSYLGYTEIRNIALYNFSDKIKNSIIWNLLDSDLRKLEPYSLGKILPSIDLKDVELNKKHIDFSKLEAKYTLVEFWFSRCKPCHRAFEKIIPLHAKYNSKGFDIIGVSTDPTNDISRWQDELQKYNFDWPNYLDENAIEAEKMNIISYPHNFLLNKKGEIINVDLSTRELQIFLYYLANQKE